MARFYARFDAGTEANLDNTSGTGGYFQQLRVSNGSASGAQFRDGLIASRSLLSTDVYDDLDAINKSGGRGTYFPPDSGPFSSDYSTYVSWSNAYTSSFDGIKTPTTNVYGVADNINYSKRPTGPVRSTDTSVVGPATPTDPIGASYSRHYSASLAVRTVLNSIQSLSSVSTTPYTRQGNNSERTFHSIWHNPTLDYFAWDDFTPGQPTMQMDIDGLNKLTNPPEIYPGGDPVNQDVVIKVTVNSYEYPNDGNSAGTIGFNATIRVSGSTELASLALNGGAQGGPLTIGTYTNGSGPTGNRGGASSWSWNNTGNQYTGILTWTIGLTAGDYTLECDGRVYDVIVTSHVGATRFVTTFPTTATNRFLVKAGNPA